jgi:hypothetical protein
VRSHLLVLFPFPTLLCLHGCSSLRVYAGTLSFCNYFFSLELNNGHSNNKKHPRHFVDVIYSYFTSTTAAFLAKIALCYFLFSLQVFDFFEYFPNYCVSLSVLLLYRTNAVHSDSPFGLNPRLGTESRTDVHSRMSRTPFQ